MELITELRVSEALRLFGKLNEGPQPGTMEVAGEVLPLIAVVAITELKPSFWKRTSGYPDFGWTLAKANKAQTINAGGEARSASPTTRESTKSAEVVAAVDLPALRLDSPELDLTATLREFASLTESERFRTDLNLRARYEIFHDFFLGLTLSGSYDTRPPQATAAKGDCTSALSAGVVLVSPPRALSPATHARPERGSADGWWSGSREKAGIPPADPDKT